jgi:hypothetical protein
MGGGLARTVKQSCKTQYCGCTMGGAESGLEKIIVGVCW